MRIRSWLLVMAFCISYNQVHSQNAFYNIDSVALKIIRKNISYPSLRLQENDKGSIVLAKIILNKKGSIDSVIVWNKTEFSQEVKRVLYLTDGKWTNQRHRKNLPIVIPFIFFTVNDSGDGKFDPYEFLGANLWQPEKALPSVLYKPFPVLGFRPISKKTN